MRAHQILAFAKAKSHIARILAVEMRKGFKSVLEGKL